MQMPITSEENPFERETQQIADKQCNKDLNHVTKVMELSRNKRIDDLQRQISQYIENPDRQFHPDSLKTQLQYLSLFYNAVMNQQPVNVVNNLAKSPSHKFRLLQLNINMKLKNGSNVDSQQIQQLCRVLKNNPILLQQAMMKLVGCRSIKRMESITKQQIEDLTPDLKKRAIKLQIASDWKYFINQQQQSLQLKAEALKLWTQLNYMSRIQQNKRQLQQLKALCKAKKLQTTYAKKLTTIKKIMVEFQKLPDLTMKDYMEKRKKKGISFLLPYFLSTLQLQQPEKMKDSKSISSSVLRKKGILDERRQIGKRFYDEISKNNFMYATIMPENRFQYEMGKRLGLALGVLDRIFKKRYRVFFESCRKK